MHVRPVLRSDIPDIVAAVLSVLPEDPLATACFPDQHSPACHAFFVRRYRLSLCTPGFQGFVCVSDSNDKDNTITDVNTRSTEEGEILGFAFWQRHGSSAASPTVRAWMEQQEHFSDKLERSLLRLESMYTNMLPSYLKRGVSEETLRTYAAATKGLTTFARVKSGEGAWELEQMVTRPEHRRKGVGKRLVEWGVSVARQEGVPVIVSSTPMGRPLYEKFGFRVVGFKELGIEGLGRNTFMILDSRDEWVREAGEEESWVYCKEDGWMKVDVVWRE